MPARIAMTNTQRATLLALPTTEEQAIRHHSLDPADLAAVAEARTPETRLGYALQLCTLRYPGRHLRRGEVMSVMMLDHIAEQIGVEAEVLAGFARRNPHFPTLGGDVGEAAAQPSSGGFWTLCSVAYAFVTSFTTSKPWSYA